MMKSDSSTNPNPIEESPTVASVKSFNFRRLVRLLFLHLPVSSSAIFVAYKIAVVLTYFSVCTFSGGPRSYHQRRARNGISNMTYKVETYRKAHGVLPHSLQDLAAPPNQPQQLLDPEKLPEYTIYDHQFNDGWGRPFRYSIANDSPVTSTLGADGEPGGVGLNADLSNLPRDQSAVRIPFSQYMNDPSEFHYHETDMYIVIYSVPVVFGVLACLPIAVFASSRPLSVKSLFVQFIGSTVYYVAMGPMILGAFYLFFILLSGGLNVLGHCDFKFL